MEIMILYIVSKYDALRCNLSRIFSPYLIFFALFLLSGNYVLTKFPVIPIPPRFVVKIFCFAFASVQALGNLGAQRISQYLSPLAAVPVETI